MPSPADDPQDAPRWEAVEEATELLREGDVEAAMRELNAVLDRDPSNAYAHHFLGVAHFERKDFELARAAYEHAIAHAPKYLGAHVGLGHSLREVGRIDDAIRAGERALALVEDGPGDPEAHYLLGLAHADKGERVRAIAHLEAFIDSKPELEARYEAEAVLQTLKGQARPLEPV